jgi:hypothetical protein
VASAVQVEPEDARWIVVPDWHVFESPDVLDVELGQLVEAYCHFYGGPRDPEAFKAALRPMVEGAANGGAYGEAFGTELIGRFEQLSPFELIALAGVEARQALGILTAHNPEYLKLKAGRELRSQINGIDRRMRRRFSARSFAMHLSRNIRVAVRHLRTQTRSRESRPRVRASPAANSRGDPSEPGESDPDPLAREAAA